MNRDKTEKSFLNVHVSNLLELFFLFLSQDGRTIQQCPESGPPDVKNFLKGTGGPNKKFSKNHKKIRAVKTFLLLWPLINEIR